MGKKILAIIPARGGSKGIPRKNLKPLAGKPLLLYTIEAAKNCKLIDKVVVSTEDEEIAKVAKDAGAEVINRPPELAEDTSPTEPCMFHAVEELEKQGYVPDYVVLLQATSPLRGADDIERAILEMDKGYDSLVSVTDVRVFFWEKTEDGFKPLYPERLRRQDLEPKYQENGAIYITKKDILMNEKNRTAGKIGAIVMDDESAVDIDAPLDFLVCEAILKERNRSKE